MVAVGVGLADVEMRVGRGRDIALGGNGDGLVQAEIFLVGVACGLGEGLADGDEALIFVIVMTEDADVAGVGQGAAEGLEAELVAGAVNVGDGLEELGLAGDGGEAVEVHGVIVAYGEKQLFCGRVN